MATTYSLQVAKGNLIAAGAHEMLRPDELHGRLRVAYFEKVVNGEAATATIELTKVPAGAKILAIIWASDDLTASAHGHIAIGDAADVDRLVSEIEVAAALPCAVLTLRTPDALTDPTLTVPTVQTVGFGYRYSAETMILATLSAGTLVLTAAAMKFAGCIFYTTD